MRKEAKYYRKLEDNKVECQLCPHGCILTPGKAGICTVRVNREGTLIAESYGETISLTIDPIEKKPLYHFYPGKEILSVGPNGCNLRCPWCQNWTISQVESSTSYISPEQMVKFAREYNSIGVSYTYTEPLVWYEYLLDTAKLVKDAGMVNVLVTNGYINEAPLRQLLPFVDAMNVDVKSMDDGFYKKYCKAKLAPVLRTVEIAKGEGCHVEVTNLIITDLNDSEEQIQKLVDWVAGIDDRMPVHFSRYFPQYKMNNPPTPQNTLEGAYELAKKKLKHVYLGNIHLPGRDDSYCPNCGNVLVARRGYTISLTGLKRGCCNECGSETDFVLGNAVGER